jgi:MFS family permease
MARDKTALRGGPGAAPGPWDEVSRDWATILAALIAICVSTLPTYAFSVFMEPLSAQFGRGRTAIAAWSLFWSVGCIVAAPGVGLLVDRVGARPVLLVALPVFGTVLLGVSTLTSSLPLLFAGAVAIGAATMGVSAITCGRLIASRFNRGLGTALGLMSSGIGVSAMLAPMVMQRVIDAHGWRWGFGAMAAAAYIALPLVWILTAGGPARPSFPAAAHAGHSLPTALRSPTFWWLALATFGFGVCVGGANINMMPYLAEAGFSRSVAAGLLGLYGIFTVTGRLLTGVMLDRISLHVAVTMAGVLTGLAVVFLVLGLGPLPLVVAALAMFGFAVGAETDCLAYCTVKLFGRRSYGAVYGVLGIGALYIGSGVGPILFSAAAAAFGSYAMSFALWSLLALSAAIIFLVAARTPYLGATADAAPAPS